MNLRKRAQGQECEARLPGICNGNQETTVLAHLRRCGIAGVGQKPVDLCGIPMCSACHDETDRRTRRIPAEELDGYLLDALCRTLDRYAKEGVVRW